MKILKKTGDLVAGVLMAGWTLSMPLVGINSDYTQSKAGQEKTETKPITTPHQIEDETPGFFPIFYRNQCLLIDLQKVYKRTIKKGDAIEPWWVKEGRHPKDIDLAKLIFLILNDPKYYPADFDRNYDLYNYEIELITGEEANFYDPNGDGEVYGEKATPLKVSEVQRITWRKNNYGELKND